MPPEAVQHYTASNAPVAASKSPAVAFLACLLLPPLGGFYVSAGNGIQVLIAFGVAIGMALTLDPNMLPLVPAVCAMANMAAAKKWNQDHGLG